MKRHSQAIFEAFILVQSKMLCVSPNSIKSQFDKNESSVHTYPTASMYMSFTYGNSMYALK